MVEYEFKKIIAENLVYFRKRNGYTQLQLAEQLQYSDKAISKWERGESLPDAYTLYTIAELYGVKLDDFLVVGRKPHTPITHKTKFLITGLSSLIPWIIASVIYVILVVSLPDLDKTWLAFVYAIPVSALVSVILGQVWRFNLFSLISASIVTWGLCCCIYYTWSYVANIYWVFIIAIPLQIGLVFWYLLRYILKKRHHKD